MLGTTTLFFKEGHDSVSAMRINLLASMVLEALRNWRAGQNQDGGASLRRGLEFLQAGASFCRGEFTVTAEGITSTEAFAALARTLTSDRDMSTFAEQLSNLSNEISKALEGQRADVDVLEELFIRLREQFTDDAFTSGYRPERWRL